MELKPSYIGKVRDVYDLGDRLVLSSSDRISAFDCVFEEMVLGKGIVLTNISNHWFGFFQSIPNHIISTRLEEFPKEFQNDGFKDRAVLVKKTKRIDFECVVRGYLSGSGFKEYKTNGTLAGLKLPNGMLESEKLSEPRFTPAVKNDSGHDENISEKEMEEQIGKELFTKVKNYSLEIFEKASELVSKSGLILCDTKFEFGIYKGEVILIDELLTPDSSRYWAKDTYQLGISPPSFDKQILRNYLESTDWNKQAPPPKLPEHIIKKLMEKYREIERKLLECILEKSV
ncbi:MAG: phosphoribosylaminoimidazolesuccinocarboxamide synthase [Leptospiraceae bacterium]|nr:phosphoribosylaminoimidazolesuccinocarboxamide synthase [Leptospiraceae bacterium]